MSEHTGNSDGGKNARYSKLQHQTLTVTHLHQPGIFGADKESRSKYFGLF